ncbi:MAG: HNH endonuclease [Verrucomicrobiota bacterium]
MNTETLIHRNQVLVLNRNWQAINVTTPAMAFCQMITDIATGLDIEGRDQMTPVEWKNWVRLPIRPSDGSVGTASGNVRIPTVIVLSNFARVPLKRPKFSARAIRERDGGQCQYTGAHLRPDEGNIDHVMPRSRGGKTSWKNCVFASKKVNTRKANLTPEEAGLQLRREPRRPNPVPVTAMLRNPDGIPDWEPFLL